MSLNPNFRYKADFDKLFGDSEQAKYLVNYLEELKAETCIVETYIDKDYLIDYQKFYARSFKQYKRFTERFHFFENKIDVKDFEKLLKEDNVDGLKKLLNNYVGFVIKKPVKDSFGDYLIGRTLLKTYPKKDRFNHRYFVTTNHLVSLFGIPLTIESVPFQMQDQRVSACATIALWTTLHALSDIFEIHKSSPVEITEVSTSYVSRFRNFPQGGLTLGQMLNCIRAMELDIEVIKFDPSDPNLVTCAVIAYLTAGIPLIAHLRLKRPDEPKVYHAAVITGYKCDKDRNLIELYVHDDGIGPYSRVEPDGNFKKWKNEWNDRGYEVFLEELLVPLYPKIRLQFKDVYFNHLQKIKKIQKMKEKDDITLEIFLTTVQDYKKDLLAKNFDSKLDKIKGLFPRFLWIERVYYKGLLFLDWIFDGTAVYPREIDQSPIRFS